MDALLQQTAMSLRLHYRNRMALLYGYLFPLIFLLAFYVLYRHERVVLVRHMGELLTVGILGGACFGLPTTLVSERERGVWRRYRLAPIPTAALVASTVAARYLILVTAGLLQLGAALALGMPLPRHPAELWLAFTAVSFAFIGLGLVMAAMADNVPAVQALGQCIFLPMLIIGGVAVPLGSLPDWAQHLSAFFPGRYAVQAIQSAINGSGLGAARFDLLALATIGTAGCLAGGMLFRWDAQQRFASRRGKGWIAVALAAWMAVGAMAEARHRVAPPGPSSAAQAPVPAPGSAGSARAPVAGQRASMPPVAAPPAGGTSRAAEPAASGNAPAAGKTVGASPPAAAQGSAAQGSAAQGSAAQGPAAQGPAAHPPAARGSASQAPDAPGSNPLPAQPIAATWQAVTPADIERDLVFDRLPADSGVVSPIAPADEEPAPEVMEQLEGIRIELPGWGPAKVADTVQRVRNILYIAAVPDVHQTELERFTTRVVFDYLRHDVPKADLMKALYWIALHPMDGDDSAIDRLPELGFENRAVDAEQVRERVALYAVKLLGRLTGAIRGS